MRLTRQTYLAIALSAVLMAGIPFAVYAQENTGTGNAQVEAMPPETRPIAEMPAVATPAPVAPVADAPNPSTPATEIPPAAPAPVTEAPVQQAYPADEAPEYESCPEMVGAAPPPRVVDIVVLEKEAQAGSAQAALDLANEYARLKQFAEAEKWYRFSLYKGEGRAALGLYELHASGSIALKDAENIKRYGLNLIQESAKKGGGGAAMNLALVYLYGQGAPKDYAKARDWFKVAERAGKPMASYELGLMYSNGLYLDVSPRRAFHYFEKAAVAGIAPAARQVAIAYHTGIGTVKNLDKAITCYTRSAHQGDMLAMRDLGNIYRLERPNSSLSQSWYSKAADLGDADSQYMLGRFQEAAKQKHHLARIQVDPDYVPKE